MPTERTASSGPAWLRRSKDSLRVRRWGLGPRLRRRIIEHPRESAFGIALALIVCVVATGRVPRSVQTVLFVGGIALVCIDDRLGRRKS